MSRLGLKGKAITGTFWSATDAFLGQGVTFVVGLVLARLLSPEEYGLIGIVTIFTTVLLGIVDSGFANSLIRKQTVTENDYSTLFGFNLAVSVVLYGLLYGCAPLIATFFDKEQLVDLVRVMGLLLILQATSIVQMTDLSRKIDFRTKTKASFVSAITSGAIGLGMAFTNFGVWSLVGQQLSRQFVYSICLWFLNRWIPKGRISLVSLRYMWGFGWKLMVSGILDRLWGELKKVVVSKFYSPAALGQYSRSAEYASIFSSNITSIIQRVSYPVLAQVQDDKERMVGAYRRVIKTSMFGTAIVMFALGAISEPLIYCLIGPQWHQAALFLPFLCVYRSLYPLQAINLNMLQVQGRTDIYLYLEIVKKTISLFPLFIGAFVGIYWMLIASIFTNIVFFFLNSYYTGKHLGYTSWMQLKDVAPSYGIASLVALSVFFLKYLPFSYWIVLPIQIIVGTVVCFGVCEFFKLPEYLEIKDIVFSLFNNFLKRGENGSRI